MPRSPPGQYQPPTRPHRRAAGYRAVRPARGWRWDDRTPNSLGSWHAPRHADRHSHAFAHDDLQWAEAPRPSFLTNTVRQEDASLGCRDCPAADEYRPKRGAQRSKIHDNWPNPTGRGPVQLNSPLNLYVLPLITWAVRDSNPRRPG